MRALLLICLAARAAGADPQLQPVVDRNYAIDLYDGNALGNAATIAVGGAAAANAMGSSGTLINVSAPAVRPTTDADDWSWDYHLDYLNAQTSGDYTNSGLPMSSSFTGSSAWTGGLAVRIRDWAAAITAMTQTVQVGNVTLPTGTMTALDAATLHAKLAIATWQAPIDTAIGVAIDAVQFDLLPGCNGNGCGTLFEIQGAGLEAGAQWIPHMEDFRVGLDVMSSARGGKVAADACAGMEDNCNGFILPESVVSAWRVVGGIAYRQADTAWNQQIGGHYFRDERALTLTSDLVVTGPTSNGYGLDAFAQHMLERSGRHASYSLRGGAEYEWLPGRLRLRGGSYWEPGRFEGVPGRLHITFGLEVRVFEFHAFGVRRGRITLTADTATAYKNVGISIGFWH